jgi:hypothetical protein
MKINAQEQTIIALNRERFLLAKENASLSRFYRRIVFVNV